jgi:hypothetical protein
VSASAILLSTRHADLLATAVDLSIEVTGQLIADDARDFAIVLLKALGDDAEYRRLVEDSTTLTTTAMETAARLGFALGLTMATQAARGNRAWVAEALAVAEGPTPVEYRPEGTR